ncbi:MAG: ribonucleotide-diphosphate reductase subunit beta [Waterburya sp.]
MPRQIYDPNIKPSNEIFGIAPASIVRFNNPKYRWAGKLYEQMRNNFWIPQKVNLTQDAIDFNRLEPAEVRAYKGILGFLVFLDSVQTSNLPEIANHVSSPEIRLCLTEQSSQEFLHSQSYQFLVDSVLPSNQREDVYDWHFKDRVLHHRCRFISDLFQQAIDRPSLLESRFTSIVADYVLEGIYFYSGFNFFYTLGSKGLMSGTVDMIKLIHRDELTHVFLFQKLIESAIQEFNLSFNLVRSIIFDVFEEAYKTELEWTDHILGDDILGMSRAANKQYLQYLTNNRLKNVGLTEMFTPVANPYKHLDRIADLTSHATSKANFFESGVTSYTQSSSVKNWDF